jgi:WD40 repeat protein
MSSSRSTSPRGSKVGSRAGSPRGKRGSLRSRTGSIYSETPDNLTPRSRLSKTNALSAQIIVDVMRCLDEGKVANIRRYFMKHDNHAVTKYEFVRIMLQNLENFAKMRDAMYETVDRKEEERKEITTFDLVSNLRELFDEIDINGDQYVEWDEFTAFIVEKAGLTSHVGLDALTRFEEILKENAMRTQLTQPIEKAFFLQPLDAIGYYVEKEVKSDSLMTGSNASGPSIKLLNVEDLSVLAHLRSDDVKGTPTAFEYVGKPLQWQTSSVKGQLAVSCTDSSIVLWSLDQNQLHPFKVSARWPTPHTQCGLLWDPRFSLLYSASVAGLVHAWDTKEKAEVSCMYGHTDMVMNLCDMKKLEAISSCSMDRTICIWDLHTGARRQLLEGHQKGVLSLTYNDDYKLLLSAGFDHDALVWSPFSPTVIFKLKGHKNSLVGIDSIEGTNQVVTTDVDGIYKIWDLRNFQCVQTFCSEPGDNADKGLEDDLDSRQITSFCFCQNRIENRVSRLIGTTRRCHVFEQGIVNVDTGGADDLPVQTAIYNPVLTSIITVHGTSVKIWNALVGKLEKAFFDVTVNGSDITAICLDDRKRKFIIGDHLGDIQVHNFQSGALMKVFEPHASQITSLRYIDELKYVVSVSWDGAVVVHDEDPADQGVVVRTMDVANTHRGDISCAAVSFNLTLIATGAADKTVRVWDFETGKLEAKLNHDHEINEIIFLKPYPLIVVADSAGIVWLYGVRGCNFKYHCPLTFHHFYKHENSNSYMAANGDNDDFGGSQSPIRGRGTKGKKSRKLSAIETRTLTPVLCLAWDNERYLYTGGDRGQVACWDMKEVIEHLNVSKIGTERNQTEKVKSPQQKDEEKRNRKKNYITPELQEDLAQMVWSVNAHNDSVSSMQYIADPPALLSSSHDHCVRIWGVEGVNKTKRIGCLLQELRGAMKHPEWYFPVNVEAIESMREGKTLDILEVNNEYDRMSRNNDKSQKLAEDQPLDYACITTETTASSKVGEVMDDPKEQENDQIEAIEQNRIHRRIKRESFSHDVNASPAGLRLEELRHGEGGKTGDDDRASLLGNQSPKSDSEEEVDFDKIGFQEFRREWASSGRRIHDEEKTVDGDNSPKGDRKGLGAKKNSSFSMARTKAIRKRANKKTKLAAANLDLAIEATKHKANDRGVLGSQRRYGKNEKGERGLQLLEERLKKYGL